VEHDADHAHFAGDALRAPREVAALETQAPVFGVAAARSDEMDALWADSGVCCLASGFEGALLARWGENVLGSGLRREEEGEGCVTGSMSASHRWRIACVVNLGRYWS
jgi:hypothetical protein